MDTQFKPIKEKPQWLFNQKARCAVKVNAMGQTIETVRTQTAKLNEVMEAIDLHERDYTAANSAQEA